MMKLLLTGASGFLGSNIFPLLKEEMEVLTVGRSASNHIMADLSIAVPTLTEPVDVVLHAAGKAHVVPKMPEEEADFFRINVEGTRHLCEALEKVGCPSNFVFISTVAVYGVDCGEGITEEAPLNGITPYALSKKQAEAFLQEWCVKNKVCLTILRLPLLAGPCPPGNLGAMIKGIQNGRYLSIAGGKARKSVLMVQDVAKVLPFVLNKGGIYNLCDTDTPSFGELEKLIAVQLGKGLPVNVPYGVAWILAKIGDCLGKKAPINTLKLNKIVGTLTFDSTKAQLELGWTPLSVMKNFKIR